MLAKDFPKQYHEDMASVFSYTLWDKTPQDCLTTLSTQSSGLTIKEVSKRQQQYGLNILTKSHKTILHIVLRQITSNPLIVVLGLATLVSFLLGEHISSYYIFGMILVSIFLGFWNEYSAEKTIDSLLKKISPTTLVMRNNEKIEVPVKDITVGDIVLLSQGSIVPADLHLIEVHDLQMNESTLTGESKTAFKTSEKVLKTPRGMSDLANIAFMGTSVDMGAGKGVVVAISKNTQFGSIAKSTLFDKPSTDFEKGLMHFGRLLVNVILLFTIAIFALNALLGRPFLESLLFALAIAVGLTPELLPVIVTVSLSHGAGKLAKKKVIAKQLIAIEDLGNMDVLCTDKTGTLTEGVIQVAHYEDVKGAMNPHILSAAMICNNALVHNRIIGSGIDSAILTFAQKNNISLPQDKKIDQEAFDFDKKAMFAVGEIDGKRTLYVKGAPESILSMCGKHNNSFTKKFTELSHEGFRVVAIAKKSIGKKDEYSWKDAVNLEFVGYITFLDIPKLSAKQALLKLRKLNVTVKVITGDNDLVAKKVWNDVGMGEATILLGSDIESMSEEEFAKAVEKTTIFARINPEQKFKIIKTLRSNGHAVGYLGDGINDVPSLRNADVGISVNTAVDVAKDAAAIVLLHKGLDVIAEGIIEGRKTFSNTIKYILMSTSSNFGNMFSAAGASFLLPFLPMTPVQILLTNGLYDLSQLSIPSDNVDGESLLRPRHWNISFIRDYMVFFGPISSLYDFLTFGVMIFFFHAKGPLFQTGWFIESIATEILVVFVIRTSRVPFFTSRPGKWLLLTCLIIVIAGVCIPFTGIGKTLGFVTPPPIYFAILIALVSTYLLLVENLKSIFLKRYSL